MPLPNLKHPVFKLTLPSTKKTVTYRPYTVQEEKLLLVVKMSEDIGEIVDTMKQIIRNCILDDVDVDRLAMFDIEYLFINIRKVSVSNEVDLVYTYEGKKIPFKINLEQVGVKFNPDHTDRIILSDGVGIKMKYPTLEKMLKLDYRIKLAGFEQSAIDREIFDVILDCVENVFDEEKVYTDFTREELESFVNSLKISDLRSVQKFFTTMPALEHRVTLKVGENETQEVVLRGLKDFFSL